MVGVIVSILKVKDQTSLVVCAWSIVLNSSFKHHLGNMGFIDSTITLKAVNNYTYIQDSCFPKQQNGQKVCLFNMLVDWDGYGVDLMKWGGFGGFLDDV
jgi:hypothetical protein